MATVKLGDTLAFFVKPCRSCRTDSTTTCYVWYVTALHTIRNGYALLTTMGVQLFFVMEGRIFKKKVPILTCPDQTFIS